MQRSPHPMSRRAFCLSLVCAASMPAMVNAAPNVLHDLKYGEHELQALDVYLPSNPKNAPVMVMVHGGGWVTGDKSHRGLVKEKQQYWGAKGYIFVSVNYRLQPEANPLEQAKDVARAIAYVQTNIGKVGGDARRMVVMGHSAGAHLVSLLASNPAFALEYGARKWLGTVSLDTAAYDVEEIMTSSPSRLYRRAFGDLPLIWRATSPIAQLTRGTRPFLLICSTQRANVCPASNAFATALATHGGTAQVVPFDKSHNQLNKHLGLPGAFTNTVDHFLQSIGLP